MAATTDLELLGIGRDPSKQDINKAYKSMVTLVPPPPPPENLVLLTLLELCLLCSVVFVELVCVCVCPPPRAPHTPFAGAFLYFSQRSFIFLGLLTRTLHSCRVVPAVSNTHRQLHPDKNHAPGSEDAFKMLTASRTKLLNDLKK